MVLVVVTAVGNGGPLLERDDYSRTCLMPCQRAARYEPHEHAKLAQHLRYVGPFPVVSDCEDIRYPINNI
jgi:hypothetical protein